MDLIAKEENSCLHIAIESLEQTVSQIIDREGNRIIVQTPRY